ncbi:MAG TPA: hypothetical protein VK612_10620 [Pyrinomonadaceae bacterium]|nr:hypothetical protein [Pyrinomonadaceae bacterium]
MPTEKKPHNPLPKNYVPAGGLPYKVQTNDDWGSIAMRHNVTAKDLILFNFGTLDTAEINWYLRNNVGCNAPTRNGLNWMFTSAASPGTIYIPQKTWKRPSFPPAPHMPEPEPAPKRSGIWFGVGFQTGGHLFIAGKDTVEACVYSYESYNDRFWMNIDGYRIGPGLGASVGAAVIVISHCHTPGEVQGFSINGFDFQANIVGKWGDLAKSAKTLDTVQKYAKLGTAVDKSISILEWTKMREAINLAYKAGTTAYDVNKKAEKPEVDVIGVPFAGVGLEVSVFYGTGSVFVHGVTLESGYQ